MLWKKTKWFWKIGFMAISMILLAAVSGCGGSSPEDTQADTNENEVQVLEENEQEDVEEIIEIFMDFYETYGSERDAADLELLRSIVEKLGENGYSAVDGKNQIDMAEAEWVIKFCESVDAKEKNQITVIEVITSGTFAIYDLQTEDGKVDVTRSYYKYEKGAIHLGDKGGYQAEYWNYTKEGYLMFSGTYFSEELYVLTLSGAEEHTAFRVLPLDEKYRELNRKYLMPIGYERNNMFLVDWSEADFGSLNFYDLYDIFYSKVNGRSIPYVMNDNLGVGAVYQIPKDEFERVIMTYFNINSETLQSKTIYDSEETAYEYKPRGFYEGEYPKHPYPEVVAFTENNDGTITLTVHVVFPYNGISKAYAHEVVVRPLATDGVQYVSNRIIPSEDNQEATWHTPRLTEKEWEKGYNLPVDEQEREEAEIDCQKMMELIFGIYEKVDKKETVNVVLDDEMVIAMQEKIKETGCPVTAVITYANMENHEDVERFLEKCEEGKSGSIVIYGVYSDGGIGRIKFNFDGTDMYAISTRGIWNSDNTPGIAYVSHTRIKEWKYTDKGWFCYELCVKEPPEVTEIVDGSCMIRIKPMTEEQREMSKKCVRGLGYQGNNLLCSNWDTDHMEELDYNGMFEYLYEMKYQEKFNSQDYANGIPKGEFERLIMEYLPITAEQIREYAVFDEENQTYAWARLGCYNYAPTFFGTSLPEVTDIKENKDGTMILTVEAVCDMVICDDAVITHELTVRFAEDGSFQYLGNKILDNGIMNIPEYQYRVLFLFPNI